MRRSAALALTLTLAAQTAAGDIELGLPIDCDLSETCFIQQYVDHDPGPGAQDYTCGPLAYDGHDGTDFALPTREAMEAGVDVLAAAPGHVIAVRDEMPDIAANDPDAPDLDGRDCGNGVVLAHAGGWQTQYCHMRRGSVVVSPGEPVERGARLGEVGLSGRTEFPHLHLTVRFEGEVIDPFLPDPGASCGELPETTLWRETPAYRPGALVDLGFATEVPDYAAIRGGLDSPETLGGDAPALVLWAHAFGGRAGDVVEILIEGPDGTVIAHDEALPREQARYFRAAGLRAPDPQGWPAGDYTGTVRLLREGDVYSTRDIDVTLTD